VRKGIIPDFIPEGQEHLYPALRDKKGQISDYFVDPEDAQYEEAKAKVRDHLETLTEKPKRGAKNDA
jgi:hypothetical protein